MADEKLKQEFYWSCHKVPLEYGFKRFMEILARERAEARLESYEHVRSMFETIKDPDRVADFVNLAMEAYKRKLAALDAQEVKP